MTERFERTSGNGSAGFLEEFLKSLNYIVGLDQLVDNICAKLYEFLEAKTLYISLLEPITGRYVGKKAKGANQEHLSLLSFAASDRLIKWLNVNQVYLQVTEQPEVAKYLSGGELDILHRTNTVLIAPMIVLNRLIGAFFVTERLDQQPYSTFVLDHLGTLTAQSALAIEHATMYQLQEDRLQRLFHTDKLASLGELAAGAAHEIRNPLTSIRSTIQFLKKDLAKDKTQLVDGLIGEVDRIDHIIAGLLSFSRTSEIVKAPVNIAEVIEQTLSLLEPELKKQGVILQKDFITAEAWIEGDASQLKQVFLNIFLNSIQAVPGGGTVRVSVEVQGQRGEIVRVIVSDDGLGIPEEALPKVFDPFYTTKNEGTGLGLSISYGIVSKHSGEIQIISSTEGQIKGTSVRIDLPRTLGKSERDGS